MTDRKTFASYYGKKDAEWFSNVIWSNESRFYLYHDAPEHCIRISSEKYYPSCIKMTLKHEKRGIMVWEAFTAAGVGKLIRSKRVDK